MTGQRVMVTSFRGRLTAPVGVIAHENFWRLVSMSGNIVEVGSSREGDFSFGKFLVRFDIDVSGMGLECHNSVPNSLWILKSDLSDLAGD